jgi:hypothetical protein
VPPHLYGKAQHKTLQARLSEDILHRKLDSRFYRTDPGVFFLSELRSDPTIADQFKDPFHARRRTRDLAKPEALAVSRRFVESAGHSKGDWSEILQKAGRLGELKYVDSRHTPSDSYLIWAFSIVRRDHQILSYRAGRYRDDRDSFANRRSIGFADVVSFDDASLFSQDAGITECGLSAVLSDLDLSRSVFNSEENITTPQILFAMVAVDENSQPAIVFVMEWICPSWFEPTSRRLSLNETRWIDCTHAPNDIGDFDPWSAEALSALSARLRSRHEGENRRPANRVFRIRAHAG